MKITVFTPTYNRAHTLGRVYESLKKQTCKEFIWLIVDDGSTDNTKKLVEGWVSDNELQIDYHYKPNGGKHTAMRLAYEIVTTKYLIDIDSDDALKENAVEVFLATWEIIEKSGMEEDIAEVRALTEDNNGNLIGNFTFPSNIDYYDSNWHKMVLKMNNFNENVTCWNTSKLRECVHIPETFWLSNEAKHYGESILWSSLGRKYKTRYINKTLRTYFFDGGESIMRSSNKRGSHINSIVSSFYFLDQNIDYFWMRPSYFIKSVIFQIIYTNEYKISANEALRNMTSKKFKFFYLMMYPLGASMWVPWKILKK